jgi:hypothetical protein
VIVNRHDITEILLKVALNTITLTQLWSTIPPIAAKLTITSPLKSMNIKKDHAICRCKSMFWMVELNMVEFF